MNYQAKKQTHERIKAAFAELLAEKKELDKITVSELAERSGVTRGTFYQHFSNIFEVAEEIENEFLSTLNTHVEYAADVEEINTYLHRIFEFLSEHEDLYSQLLSSDMPLHFISNLNAHIRKTMQELLAEHNIEKPMLELDIAFFTDGASYMLLKYFRGEISLSLDEIEWYLKQRITEMFLK